MSRIVVLTGGSNAERDVAFAGAKLVVSALRGRGHSVTVVDTASGVLSAAGERRYLVDSVGRAPPTPEQLATLRETDLGTSLLALPDVRAADLIFLVLHGEQGEGGAMQNLLDLGGRTYTGSDSLGSGLAMDKDIAKRLCRWADIPTAEWEMWPASSECIQALGLPLVVKPSRVGSTVGLTVIKRLDDLEAAVQAALRYDHQVLLERFVEGREYTVGVLDNRALAVGEIIPSHGIFDYECKYTPGLSEEIFPAQIDPSLAARLQNLAIATHQALKLRDFSRVDFKVSLDGTPYCLEANTLPGLTATSLFPQSAAAVGIDFDSLCETLCDLAMRRTPDRHKVGASVST